MLRNKIYRQRVQTLRAISQLHTSSRPTPSRNYALILAVTATTAVVYGTRWHWKDIVYADSTVPLEKSSLPTPSDSSTRGPLGVDEDGHLEGVAWGSNKYVILSFFLYYNSFVRFNLLSPDSVDTIQTPQSVPWLRDVALRDLALHEKHGACVDVKGNVYQWCSGITIPNSKPTLSLRGKVRYYLP